MKLTKLIFDYWKIWMRVPEETNVWGSYDEGLGFYDWYCMKFAVGPSARDAVIACMEAQK